MLFFSEANHRGNHAGTKARNDAEVILRQYGARPVNSRTLELWDNQNSRIRSNIGNRLEFIPYYWDLLFVRNETVIIQYPMLAFDIEYDYILKLSKHNRVIFLIHDIQSLRREGHSGLEKEIQMLNLAFGLIVHNRFMEQLLKDIGIRAKRLYRLNCFDYLFEGEIEDTTHEADVVFAGNLEKSGFLATMCAENPLIAFRFYGPGWKETLNLSNAEYGGNFLPDEIPGKLLGRYGLIWDGNTTSGCTGAVGEYMRINNPHKMSLYIAAGIPVIAWNCAAAAEFIRKHRIGIIVERIDNLFESLAKVSDEQYREMKSNVLCVRERLISGSCLKTVLCAIEEEVRK